MINTVVIPLFDGNLSFSPSYIYLTEEEDHWIWHVDFCAFFWAYLVEEIIKNGEKSRK
jgi:hypothetical protein